MIELGVTANQAEYQSNRLGKDAQGVHYIQI